MPARPRRQPPNDAPPPHRSERIRGQTGASAAQAVRQDARVLGISRSSHAINGLRGHPRNPLNRVAVENLFQSNIQGRSMAVGNLAPLPTRTLSPLVLFSASSGIMHSGPQVPASRQLSERGAAQRIRRELQKFYEDPLDGCHVHVEDHNIFRWTATIDGPKNTPYEGGTFKLLLDFDEEYPFKPPDVKFLTMVYHCNITPEGNICLDILDVDWSPALTVTKLLLSIISLFSDPNANDPLVPAHAAVYLRNREEYEANARLWTRTYAKPIPNERNPE